MIEPENDPFALQPAREEPVRASSPLPDLTRGVKGEERRAERALPAFAGLLQAEEYLSVRDAARAMGVSVRSVYGYIESGKLLGIRIGASIAVQADAVRGYQRQVVGRPRTRTPVWRVPTAMNLQFLTTINVQVREDQGEKLEARMEAIRASGQHRISGTVARYIVRNHANPDHVQIVLVWRKLVMPPDEEREAAIAALRIELNDILAWETAAYHEGCVLLSAS
jgi:excisionase family DNA binding protein